MGICGSLDEQDVQNHGPSETKKTKK